MNEKSANVGAVTKALGSPSSLARVDIPIDVKLDITGVAIRMYFGRVLPADTGSPSVAAQRPQIG